MDKVVLVMTNDEMLALAGSQMKLWQSGLDLSFTKTDFERVSDQLKNRTKYDPMKQLTRDEMADLLSDYSLLLMDCDYLVSHQYKAVADAVAINNDASAELEEVFHGIQSVDKSGSLKEPEF
ncbi:hypothetical protein ACMAZN_14530 [Lactiplantibacillus plantarum]|uniref:hypothetical protein n=1 Tax=Lactiplantibacillus plantarum TaxID=1590 RepID=UPI003F7A0DFF